VVLLNISVTTNDTNPVLRYLYEAAVSCSKLEKLQSVLVHLNVQLKPLSHKRSHGRVSRDTGHQLRIQLQEHQHWATIFELEIYITF
jgi:hypothetical protein